MYFQKLKLNKKLTTIYLSILLIVSIIGTIILFFYIGYWALLLPLFTIISAAIFYIKLDIRRRINYHSMSFLNDTINKNR